MLGQNLLPIHVADTPRCGLLLTVSAASVSMHLRLISCSILLAKDSSLEQGSRPFRKRCERETLSVSNKIAFESLNQQKAVCSVYSHTFRDWGPSQLI